MATHDLHRSGIEFRRIRRVDRQSLGRAIGRPEALRLRWVIVRIRNSGVARVGLALARGRHVVDLLECAPDPLRSIRGLDRDVQPDERDLALRADDMPRSEALGDIDNRSALDVGARSCGRWIGGGQWPPGRLDRDRSDRKARRMACVREVDPAAPAVGGERLEFRRIEVDFVAGVGAVLRDERIGRFADGEARLIEVGERRERSDCL